MGTALDRIYAGDCIRGLAKFDDGSVDLYFGPQAPADEAQRKNWIKTLPGAGWFTYFRLYAPTEPYFARTWQLPDIQRLE